MRDLLLLYYDSANCCTIAVHVDGTISALPDKPVKWLRRWCVEAGSSLEGRLDGYRKKMGIIQKPALYIGGYPPQIFIPTVSMERDDCLYLRADRIRKIMRGSPWFVLIPALFTGYRSAPAVCVSSATAACNIWKC